MQDQRPVAAATQEGYRVGRVNHLYRITQGQYHVKNGQFRDKDVFGTREKAVRYTIEQYESLIEKRNKEIAKYNNAIFALRQELPTVSLEDLAEIVAARGFTVKLTTDTPKDSWVYASPVGREPHFFTANALRVRYIVQPANLQEKSGWAAFWYDNLTGRRICAAFCYETPYEAAKAVLTLSNHVTPGNDTIYGK